MPDGTKYTTEVKPEPVPAEPEPQDAEEPPDQPGELGLFSWSGCVPLLVVVVSIVSVLMGATFAIAQNIEGLLLVFVILLACILLVVATKASPR